MKKSDFMKAYRKVTRAATLTNRSAMTSWAHQEFMAIMNAAQEIIRAEARLKGIYLDA